ncbi:hypothetical protein OR1_02989 [Geobacter sp. OR-1]|uniref:outer membrane beta-barrel protein n=1 Tax=Geobacter sp. OR-1 TaxID=1266765 RepID=UPI00054407D5|nr:outer membrane beta-barrel protein [Geobacter sp. OR-1]GAM10696.1 hypothetical protein OR1_02989 [Geobacter sp. OR-1]
MKKRTVLALALIMATVAAGSASAADEPYVTARGGLFLPNGKDVGFKYFDTGYNFEVAAGYRPVPYAAIEAGTGFYSTSGSQANAGKSTDRTAYGVPVTLSAKGILEFEKLMLSAGAGVGYYFGFINTDHTNSITPGQNFSESNHGAAVGYQVLFDADFKLSQHWTVGANFKWFSAKPEIELKDPTDYTVKKQKWEFGGINIDVGAKYFF